VCSARRHAREQTSAPSVTRIGPSVHLVRLWDSGELRSVASAAAPAGCSSVTRDHESAASAEIETWREARLAAFPVSYPVDVHGRFFFGRKSSGLWGWAARGNSRQAMLRQGGSIQQTTDSLVQMIGAYFRLCQAGISLARIARRALRTRRSKGTIWLTILFHRSPSFRRRGKNYNVQAAKPRHSMSGPISGMTRNDWPRKRI
jgi:hypothetical protein